MKLSRLHILFVLLFILTSCTQNKFNPDISQFNSQNNLSDKLPDFKYETWQLNNGLKVYYIHDPELPLFSANLFLKGGSFYEKADQTGLYSALGDNLRYGGAGDRDALELDAIVEKYAASLSSSFGQEFGSLSVSGLSTDKEILLSLLQDILIRPRFNQSRLDLWKSKALEGIKRRADDPNTVASMSTRTLLLGDSAYGRFTQSKDIKAISREKLVALHSQVMIPEEAILAISGDINKQQAKELSEKYFSDWTAINKAGKNRLPELEPYPAQRNRGIFFIEKDLKQATVIAAQLGPDRHTPDIYKIDVFNQHFGSGGFGSALMKRVRTELGLAYGIYGAILPGFPKGRALIHVQTKPESVGLAIKESLDTLKGIQQNHLSAEDINEAKKVISTNFIFNFTSPAQVLGRKVEYQLTGFPEDYEDNYLDSIGNVSTEDIHKVANTYWDFDNLVILIVGPKSALESVITAGRQLPVNKVTIKEGKFFEIADFD